MAATSPQREPSAGFFRVYVHVSPLRLVVLALLSAAFAAIDYRAGLGPHDEGLMLQWGHRIAGGEWPYRDFWCNYLPGAPLLQAVLGDSLVVWRVVRAALAGLCAVLAYLLVRRETVNDRWALAAWAGVTAAMAWPLTPGPNAPALALALASLLAARRRRGWAGILAGLAFLFRPEIGVAAALGAWILDGRRSWTPVLVGGVRGVVGALAVLGGVARRAALADLRLRVRATPATSAVPARAAHHRPQQGAGADCSRRCWWSSPCSGRPRSCRVVAAARWCR